MVDASDEIVLSFIAITLVLLILVFFIVFFAFLFQRRQNHFRLERQAMKEAYEREILQSQLEIQNHTLQQIGQELHDHIGQMLSLTLIQMGALEEELAGTPHLSSVKQAFETVERTMHDVRQLSKTLDSGTVERYGLQESLSLEMERIHRTGRFQTQFQCTGTPYSLGEQTEIVLFRMAQESLNNAMKHSGGHHLSVSADYGPEQFVLIINDDGCGFDLERVSERTIDQSGSGLFNLKQRARLLGGECILNSEPGWGTRIEIRLPHLNGIPASLSKITI